MSDKLPMSDKLQFVDLVRRKLLPHHHDKMKYDHPSRAARPGTPVVGHPKLPPKKYSTKRGNLSATSLTTKHQLRLPQRRQSHEWRSAERGAGRWARQPSTR